MEITWAKLKSVVDSKSLSIQWIDIDETYWMSVFDGPFELTCKLDKNGTETTAISEFETSYKANGNKRVDQRDSEGAPYFLPKYAPTGWSYEGHPIEFKTSQLNSVYSKDENENDYGFAAIKLYDANNVELTTQGDADLYCVKTVINWEPTVDYLIVAGRIASYETITQDLRVWVIGVPDIPFNSGGSRRFVGGANLRYVREKSWLLTDGKAPKRLNYSATYHTNKFRYVFRHSAGYKIDLQLINDIYKA